MLSEVHEEGVCPGRLRSIGSIQCRNGRLDLHRFVCSAHGKARPKRLNDGLGPVERRLKGGGPTLWNPAIDEGAWGGSSVIILSAHHPPARQEQEIWLCHFLLHRFVVGRERQRNKTKCTWILGAYVECCWCLCSLTAMSRFLYIFQDNEFRNYALYDGADPRLDY